MVPEPLYFSPVQRLAPVIRGSSAPPGVTKKLSSELFSTKTNCMAAASGQVVLVTAALTRVTHSAAVNITKHASHLAFITFSCRLHAGIGGEAATDHIAHPYRAARLA